MCVLWEGKGGDIDGWCQGRGWDAGVQDRGGTWYKNVIVVDGGCGPWVLGGDAELWSGGDALY